MATPDIQATPRAVPATTRRRAGRIFRRSVLPRAVLIAGAIVFIIPFYWMVVSALKTNQELTQFPPSLIPATWNWQNFVDAVNYIPFGLYAINSLIITVGVTIGSVL